MKKEEKEKKKEEEEEVDLNKQIQETEQKLKELKKKKTEDTKEDIAVRPHCKMTVCENEKTGEIEIVYGKNCPKGYIEKIAGRVATRGMRFTPEKEEE